MNLSEIYSEQNDEERGFSNGKPLAISFEVFPPKDDETGEKLEKLMKHLAILKKYNPSLISLTYGAGGSTRNKSVDIIKRIKSDLDLNVMPHFTCVCATKSEIRDYLVEIESLGIENILALRGDIPEGMDQKCLDFQHANELVSLIKAETNLSVGVAGYPEGHIECKDFNTDLEYLKNKVDCGADVVYTQLFFDNDKFFDFVRLARKAGIKVPIIPGILPITSYNQLDKMLSMCKVSLPDGLKSKLKKFKDNPDDIKKIGIEFASSQCRQLIDSGVSGLHFYTINSSTAVSKILDNLGVAQAV